MSDDARPDRREFLKMAALFMAAAACAPRREGASRAEDRSEAEPHRPRSTGFDGALLASLGATVLPASLGADGQRAAVGAFQAWCEGYEPVAEEMHGYGYADVRYLPADPVPAWRAQLDGLDALAQRVHHSAFASLDLAQRQALVEAALREAPAGELPAPLGAPHIAIALLSQWSSTPEAWNLAMGVVVSPNTCRPLAAALGKPAPLPVVHS